MSVVNCKDRYIRPTYNNLKEWMEDSNNVYIGRAGIVFIDKQRYPKQSSVFANPFKVGRDKVIEKYRSYINELIKDETMSNKLADLKGKILVAGVNLKDVTATYYSN